MFGLLMALIGGIGRLGNSISKTVEDERTRDEARREGREYYWANDGRRRVSDNHKIARGSYGIIDATTGKYIVDKRELERQEKLKIEEENKIKKQEAVIKGKDAYIYIKYTGRNVNDSCLRLVKNDMPIKSHSLDYEWYEGQKFIEISPCRKYDKNGKVFRPKYQYIYKLYEDENFGFICPIQYTDEEMANRNNNSMCSIIKDCRVPDKGWNEIINMCKKDNIKKLVFLINIRPINQIKWMHQYCFKYGIPMGTWDEVEKACWEEHPVKWGKPEEELWSFKKWFLSKYDY